MDDELLKAIREFTAVSRQVVTELAELRAQLKPIVRLFEGEGRRDSLMERLQRLEENSGVRTAVIQTLASIVFAAAVAFAVSVAREKPEPRLREKPEAVERMWFGPAKKAESIEGANTPTP